MRPRSALTSVPWHALVAHDRYGVWSQASPHLPLDSESLPCPPCGVGGQEMTVREHDRHALLPDLVEVRRNSEPRSCRLCWWGTTRPPRGSRRPTPRSHLCAHHRPLVAAPPRASPAAPPGGRAGATAAARQRQHPAPRPTHAPRAPSPSASPGHKNRDDAGHACSEQRQHIKSALAHPPQSGTCLQRGRVRVGSMPRLGWWKTRLRDGLAGLVASHTCGASHATAMQTVASLTWSLLDLQPRRRRSHLSAQCP